MMSKEQLIKHWLKLYESAVKKGPKAKADADTYKAKWMEAKGEKPVAKKVEAPIVEEKIEAPVEIKVEKKKPSKKVKKESKEK